MMLDRLTELIRDQYKFTGPVPLHEPQFFGNERIYVMEAIDSTYVSSVGAFVDRFEQAVRSYTGAAAAVATINGTAALHVALRLAGVGFGDLVITQPLTFVATCNAIAYCGAEPVFVDVDRTTLGMSPDALAQYLHQNVDRVDCRERSSGRRIKACLPMHTFGHVGDINDLLSVCQDWGLPLVEDAAEALGSLYNGRHAGTLGTLGVLSFNGNKIITTGGGGMVLASDPDVGARAKHLTTTARQRHTDDFVHDEIGYNYRLPNINAALGCAQMENLEVFVDAKRELAGRYERFFDETNYTFVREPAGCRSNYWLNAVLCPDLEARNAMLSHGHAADIMMRPVWRLAHRLPMYGHCLAGPLENAEWLADRLVNLPSSAPRKS